MSTRVELKQRIAALESEVAKLKRQARCPRDRKLGLGGNIQALRQAAHLSINQLAALSDVSKGNISRLETSENPNPEYLTLAAIATALCVPISTLIADPTSEVFTAALKSARTPLPSK